MMSRDLSLGGGSTIPVTVREGLSSQFRAPLMCVSFMPLVLAKVRARGSVRKLHLCTNRNSSVSQGL
jgi:hypothetical protein